MRDEIETQWNVNIENYNRITDMTTDEIETQWNVNELTGMKGENSDER